MKIAINGMLLSGLFSGVEYAIWNLAKALRQYSADEYLLFIPKYSPLEMTGDDKYEVKHINLWTKSRALRIYWEYFRLSKYLTREKCDILHCPGYVAPPKLPVPLVLTIHDCFALKNPEWCSFPNRIYYGLAMKRSIDAAKQIIVPSNYIKDELISFFSDSSDKINVIPWGCREYFKPVEDRHILSQISKKYHLPEKFVLYVGNFEPKKNVAGIVDGFMKYKNNHTDDLKLVLAGGKYWGSETGKLLEKLKSEEEIFLPGYILEEDLATVYSLAELFLFPSLSEGFGFPVLEAMACGTPVVTSNCGALPETAGQAALMIDPLEAGNIAEAIDKIVSKKDYRQGLIEKGFAQVKKFSWQKTAEATVKVYQKIL